LRGCSVGTTDEGFIKYAVQMGSGAVMYMPSLIKTGSDIRRLLWRIHRQQGDLISVHYFFQNKEKRLKIGTITKYNKCAKKCRNVRFISIPSLFSGTPKSR
jgi:hypothetical protein